MSTRETNDRGRRRGREQVRRAIDELMSARVSAGVSQDQLATAVGWSQSRVSRIERLKAVDDVSVVELAALASQLGLDLSVSLHPSGDPLRDAGQQALGRRFRQVVGPAWKVTAEALLPNPGDRRSWDLFLRLHDQRVGVELETRVRDVQRVVRKMRERERDGGVDRIVLVLSASAHNRLVLPELLGALGPAFATPARQILRALREGRPVPGSAVILL